MNKILEWIKANVKEGVDVSEVTKLVEGVQDLNSIDTKEKAIELMKTNAVFKSGFDSEISKIIDTHDKEKLPELKKSIRDELEKELNPDLTPEQKRIKALEDELNASKNEKAVNMTKAELRTKAKELGFDPDRAEKYHVFGEKAFETLENDSKYFSDAIKAGIDTEIKTRFGNKIPPGGNRQVDTSKIMNRDDFEGLGAAQKQAFIADGGTLED